VGVHASISVAQALLAADVVDELRLVIAPLGIVDVDDRAHVRLSRTCP
jgi:riboflavin biosynthesis pyrimidine reductase